MMGFIILWFKPVVIKEISKEDFVLKEQETSEQKADSEEKAVDAEEKQMTKETFPVSADEGIQIGKKDISVKSILLVLGGAILCWLMLVNAAR